MKPAHQPLHKEQRLLSLPKSSHLAFPSKIRHSKNWLMSRGFLVELDQFHSSDVFGRIHSWQPMWHSKARKRWFWDGATENKLVVLMFSEPEARGKASIWEWNIPHLEWNIPHLELNIARLSYATKYCWKKFVQTGNHWMWPPHSRLRSK